SADVPYAVWQYWLATGDDGFMRDAGAEILIECARFWASRVEKGKDSQFHILHVEGPDEYHEGVDDDAFTNIMAAWALERAFEAVQWLKAKHTAAWRALSDRLSLKEAEPSLWRQVAGAMYTGFDESTGLIEQFTGFFKLEDIGLTAYEPRSAPMDILLGRERTMKSQVVKQADVLMLFQLLEDQYSREVIEKNYLYYEPRTGHGSSLSPSTHALIAARLGYLDDARRYFKMAASIDLDNSMGNSAGGIHAAACGGLWQSVVLGFAGMRVLEGMLVFDPHIPPEWSALSLPVMYRGRRLRVEIKSDPPEMTVSLTDGAGPVTVGIGDTRAAVEPGDLVRAVNVEGRWVVKEG
ncbi:MAG: glycosyl hydrolase family 65 protein, partial [Blastocatellia bacterium]